MLETLLKWLPFVGAVIAPIALYIAIKNYHRKSGLNIRGDFIQSNHGECNDLYVTKVLLQNLKDRAVTIFAIYLRIGHNYYIEIENFDNTPMTLKAYESYQKDFGPIQYYYSNLKRFDLNNLLSDYNIKKRLVLSTSDGKYVVPKPIAAWSPINEYFRNGLTAVIYPVSLLHKGNYVGENVAYIVDFKLSATDYETVLLSKNSFLLNLFKDFKLTKECLMTKENLKIFLENRIAEGKLRAESFTIHETAEWQKGAQGRFGNAIPADHISWLDYYVVGPLATWNETRKLRKQNRSVIRLKRR